MIVTKGMVLELAREVLGLGSSVGARQAFGGWRVEVRGPTERIELTGDGATLRKAYDDVYGALRARGRAREPHPRWLNMDGEIHTNERDCCRSLGKTCRTCGGFVHCQPVYGAIAESCELCEVNDWQLGSPPGAD